VKITLSDLFKYGNELIIPKDPVSLYRYMEHIIEVCIKRKYKLENILEIGPGTDAVFNYLRPNEYKTGVLIDYNEEILNYNKERLSEHALELINLDVMDQQQVKSLNRNWEYIVANGVIEHLKNDKEFVNNVHELLDDNGIFAGSTVLRKRLYNKWDHAAGHYRRYNTDELQELFSDFEEVLLIQSSLLQELVRPLFYGRISHMFNNTLEENNAIIGREFLNYGTPPYAGIFGILRYIMPFYLIIDWTLKNHGGICFFIARK